MVAVLVVGVLFEGLSDLFQKLKDVLPEHFPTREG